MNKNKINANQTLLLLNRNEYFFNHPPDVIRALTSPYEENFISHYAKTDELNYLKKEISKLYNVDQNLVLLGHGAEDIFVKILSWFRKEMDAVVIEDFSWTNYFHIAEGFQYKTTTVSTIEKDNAFYFNTAGFYEILKQLKSAIVFITSPNNPTGHCIDTHELTNLASLFPQHLFILDSVYDEIKNKNYTQFLSLQNCILVGSFSKFFGMPGLRLGYALGQLPRAFQLNLGLQPSTIYAALAALDNFNIYQENRDFMLSFSNNMFQKNLTKVKIYQSYAPFFLVKLPHKILNTTEAEEISGVVPKYILRNKENFIRFGLGPKEICDRIEYYLTTLYSS